MLPTTSSSSSGSLCARAPARTTFLLHAARVSQTSRRMGGAPRRRRHVVCSALQTASSSNGDSTLHSWYALQNCVSCQLLAAVLQGIVIFLCAVTLLTANQTFCLWQQFSMQAAAPKSTVNPTSTLTTPPAATSCSAPVSSRTSGNPSSGKESNVAAAHGNTSKSSNPKVCNAFVIQQPRSSYKACAQCTA